MFNIGNFLEKFKNITPPDKFVKDVLIGVVKDVVNIEIEKENIDVRNGTIFISADPIIKNEIFLKKSEIMQNLTGRLKQYKKTIREIR
ncbi:MAG: hypothetical protein ACE5F2_00280 [Candidatus Paceibacteria bacterium]